MNNQYTYKNHLWWAYDNIKYSVRSTIEPKFSAGIGRCTYAPKSLKEEFISTAKLIRQSTNKDIIVQFSGGIDSEIIVRSFLEAQIPINIIIYKYKDEINKHDFENAVQSCLELNVLYKLINLDVIKLWKKDYLLDNFHTPTTSILKYSIDTFKDCYVINGFAPFYFQQIEEKWFFYLRELSLYPYQYSDSISQPSCGAFFLYKPENLLAAMRDPIINDILENKVSINKYYEPVTALRGEFLAKFALYQSHFPDLRFRPKYIGYEHVKQQYRDQGKTMLEHGPIALTKRNSVQLFEVNALKNFLCQA